MTEILLPGKVKADFLIHIVDPDPTICEGLSLLFRLEGFETTFSLSSDHFLSAVEKRRPDLAVMNIKMSSNDGESLLRAARKQCHGLLVVMLTNLAPLERVVSAMKEGAVDVLSKPVDNEKLLAIVRGALGQNVRVHTDGGGKSEVTVSGFNQITPREREVLQLLVNGFSNKASANVLEISHRTVEVHRARIMQKLNARNTADLMRIVLSS